MKFLGDETDPTGRCPVFDFCVVCRRFSGQTWFFAVRASSSEFVEDLLPIDLAPERDFPARCANFSGPMRKICKVAESIPASTRCAMMSERAAVRKESFFRRHMFLLGIVDFCCYYEAYPWDGIPDAFFAAYSGDLARCASGAEKTGGADFTVIPAPDMVK